MELNDIDSNSNSNSRFLFRKVITVSAGEAHTLALTGDGCVYSWGRGMFGRLGNGSEADELSPVRIKFSSTGEKKKPNIVGVAAGAYHSIALADDGSVWCWGYNVYGQLGYIGENSAVPLQLEQFHELGSSDSLIGDSESKKKVPLKVSSVKAGGMMSLAIDNLGALWIWGNFPQKAADDEAAFSLVSSSIPIPVWDFHGHTVVKVACGNEHVVALVSAGETYQGEDLVCYSWGSNSHGQLGLGDKESRVRPEIVETFNQDSKWEVYELACGAFHTALLTHKKRPSNTVDSLCWTFGLGENGQLGHGNTQSALIPQVVHDLPENVYFVSIDCGLFHTSVVSSVGDVWSWGMEKGLGLCPDASFTGTEAGDAISPLLIPCSLQGPRFHNPVQVACGAAHTVVVAHDGYKIWSWGRGRSGVLGNGNTIDYFAPTIALWPPQTDDFKQEELNTVDEKDKKIVENSSEGSGEADKRLSLAMEEIKLIQSKLSTMERYASILHGSIYGKPLEEQDIPISLKNTGIFDIAKEWENVLESGDQGKLLRLEGFYQQMLAGVKDKLMKIRIKEIVNECLQSSARRN